VETATDVPDATSDSGRRVGTKLVRALVRAPPGAFRVLTGHTSGIANVMASSWGRDAGLILLDTLVVTSVIGNVLRLSGRHL